MSRRDGPGGLGFESEVCPGNRGNPRDCRGEDAEPNDFDADDSFNSVTQCDLLFPLGSFFDTGFQAGTSAARTTAVLVRIEAATGGVLPDELKRRA
jgi:hypothetical protein